MLSLLGQLFSSDRGPFSSVLTWSSVTPYLVILTLTWLSYLAFIQPLLSPLRKIPGTFFNPFLGNMRQIAQGQAMESTINMLKEHGTLVRYYFMFGRERLAIADPEILKQVLVTNAKQYIKPPSRLFMMKTVLGNGLVMSEGATHAAHKRLMSPAFNNTAIKKMLPVFAKRMEYLVDFWRSKLSEGERSAEVDIHVDLTRVTLDIIGETAFGYDFDSLTHPDMEITQAFSAIISGSGLNWRFLIPYYYKLPVPEVNKLHHNMSLIKNTVHDIISRKQELIEKKDTEQVTKDVLGMMMMARDETGQGMTEGELRDQVMTLMFAGHETTAVSMSWCLLSLAEHPALQERARQEILSVFSDHTGDISWDDLEQLKFCDNIIKETLSLFRKGTIFVFLPKFVILCGVVCGRMYPAVPLTLREATADDTFKDTYFIPRGTIMLLAIGPMMRLPQMFQDPDTFNPDRFDDPEIDKTFYKYIPFLVGSRMCLGHKFAVMEMKTLLVVLLQKLRFEKIDGTSYVRRLRTTMRPDPPLRLKVTEM